MAVQKTGARKKSAQRSEGAKAARKAAPSRPPLRRPQLANPIVKIRTSERRSFKRCPQQWWWAYREGLESKRQKDALWFGTGIHEALAAYYGKQGLKRGPHPVETWKKWCSEEYRVLRVQDDFDDTFYVEARELGIAMLTGYVEQYAEGEDQWMSMVAVETPFQVLFQRADGSEFEYDGTFDGVYRDLRTGRLWLLEHKTAKSIREGYLSLDDQAGSYLAVATVILRDKGVLGPDEELYGILYNFLRKQMPDTRPRDENGMARNKPKKEHYLNAFEAAGVACNPRAQMSVMAEIAEAAGLVVLGDISAVQGSPLFERFPIWRDAKARLIMTERIVTEEAWMAQARTGALPLFKTPTRDCTWDCDFFEMCELQEQGGDWEEMKQVAYRVRDPYADHRKSASEGLK